MVNRVSTYELRDNLALYLRRVEENEVSVVVERRNKPVAVIKPFSKEDQVDPNFNYYFGFLGKSGKTGKSIVNSLRRNKLEAVRTKDYRVRK